VNAPFVIDGETRYKHFLFYRINCAAKFYLMLLSDSTALQEEQTRRAHAAAAARIDILRRIGYTISRRCVAAERPVGVPCGVGGLRLE